MELSFRQGDCITIYGEMDDDGFYMGELNGQRGLVPSNFLQSSPLQRLAPSLPAPGTIDERKGVAFSNQNAILNAAEAVTAVKKVTLSYVTRHYLYPLQHQKDLSSFFTVQELKHKFDNEAVTGM